MIQLRPAAVQELQRLLRQQPCPSHQILLTLEAGGCSEWTYRLGLPSPHREDLVAFHCDELEVLVPSRWVLQLQDLTIDYAEDLMGGGFRFVNPQARQTCGCGNSFSTSADWRMEDCNSPFQQ
ncbi:MAG TPA: iron-sulfur cluster assembly accessory protein [Leptolyngbyaceae cyanobacterium M65_K2018_010]|nr:iron-sulfur cluster assembly accessory protein [Leptolyngbyaceae cyanobacterium M65_K2018_010]